MERQDSGLKRLINRYRRKFETPENINYYSYKDFKRAQRKYIKLMLKGAVQAQPGL